MRRCLQISDFCTPTPSGILQSGILRKRYNAGGGEMTQGRRRGYTAAIGIDRGAEVVQGHVLPKVKR